MGQCQGKDDLQSTIKKLNPFKDITKLCNRLLTDNKLVTDIINNSVSMTVFDDNIINPKELMLESCQRHTKQRL
jgi:hypothetical protein